MDYDDDYHRHSEYPQRGQYGDTTLRCAWCGKETTYLQRACFGGSNRCYCSYSCSAAGSFYSNIVCATFLLILIYFLLVIAPTNPNAYVAPSEIIIFFLGVPELLLFAYIYRGYTVRRESN